MNRFDEHLRRTFEKTAEALTGKTISLYFRDPLARGANGECYKSEGGITRINISPRLTIQQAYNVALHEIAHAKLDREGVPLTKGQYALTANLDARKVNAQPAQLQEENAADVLAAKWQARGHEAIKHMIRWNTTEAQRAVMNMVALQTLSQLQEI